MKEKSGKKQRKFNIIFLAAFAFFLFQELGGISPLCFSAEKKEDDVGKIFLEKLVEQVKWILNEIREPMLKKKQEKNSLEKGEKEAFMKTDICWFCRKKIEGKKVADHCHLTGKISRSCS